MPVERLHYEADAPDEPHLLILTGMEGTQGLWTALPPGANLTLVEDPSKMDKIFPMVLAKVSRKALDFVCACGQPNCNRRIRFVANVSGWHSEKQRPKMQKDPSSP